MSPTPRRMGLLLVLLVVVIAALLFASHEFFPAFNPAGGTSAAK
ncbi:hypothetical protein [Lichenibacterium ramalinae]|nr:hypothetical protein [Lichenibacterium ramalinae]